MSTPPGKPASNSPAAQEQWLGSSPGERLQNARQTRGWEVPEVAEKLNLSPGVVRALEADDYRLLPNPIFVRGYLRSYARLLDLNGDELVRAYEALTGYKPQKVVPVAPPLITDPRKTRRNLLLVLLVLGAIGTGAWLLGQDGSPVPQSASTTQPPVQPVTDPAEPLNPALVITRPPESTEALMEAAQAVEEPVEDDSLAAADETAAPPAEPASVEPAAGPAAEVTAPATAGASEPLAQAPAAAVPTVPASEPEPVASADSGSGLLNLRFQGECWVEVRDGSGRMVFSSLKRAGEEVTLRAATPIHVKLGNGDVVNVQYNRQPVNFVTRPDRKVVRLTLGE